MNVIFTPYEWLMLATAFAMAACVVCSIESFKLWWWWRKDETPRGREPSPAARVKTRRDS